MIQKMIFCAVPMGLLLSFAVTPASEPDAFEGQIISAMENQLVVKDIHSEEERMFIVDDSTVILLNGQPAKLRDLQPHFQAFVSAEFENGVWFATTIDVTTAEFVQDEVLIHR